MPFEVRVRSARYSCASGICMSQGVWLKCAKQCEPCNIRIDKRKTWRRQQDLHILCNVLLNDHRKVVMYFEGIFLMYNDDANWKVSSLVDRRYCSFFWDFTFIFAFFFKGNKYLTTVSTVISICRAPSPSYTSQTLTLSHFTSNTACSHIRYPCTKHSHSDDNGPWHTAYRACLYLKSVALLCSMFFIM